ncbi:hypothetical protein [Roseicyclus persicicus]|uniref:Uncharacterized protein n=1 Tax=Roseicyclus persicicus TaxID=2650661 RepID=A0A7X6JZM6_9RHOB|nr:hypothetical protein [Roseibacterium persicicum]NKX44968.1 hypothetical protein [Roseibacterium persicicum]
MSLDRTAAGLRRTANILLLLGIAMMAAAMLAGSAGHGLQGALLSAAALIVARVMAKPWLVTRIGQPGMAMRLAGEAAGQAGLAFLLVWAGGGVAALTGMGTPAPLWLPPVMILALALVMRAVWRPVPLEVDGLLDDAIASVERAAPAPDLGPEPAPDPRPALPDVPALDALPETGLPAAALVDALIPLMATLPPEELCLTLHDRAEASRTDRDLRLMVVGLTDPHIARQRLGHGDLIAAFDLVRDDGSVDVVSCFDMQVTALLDLVPEAARDLPDPERIAALGRDIGGPLGDNLADLAARADRLRRQEAAE